MLLRSARRSLFAFVGLGVAASASPAFAKPTEIAPPPAKGAASSSTTSSSSSPTQTTTTTVTTTTTTTTTGPDADKPCSSTDASKPCTAEMNTGLVSMASLRGSFLHVSGPENTGSGGAEFWLTGEGNKTFGLLTLHSNVIAGIGGGSGGVEGALGFFGTAGIRAPVSDVQGPFARVGLGGELIGNQQFYFSHFDLPIGEVGYQYLDGPKLLEIGFRAAPLLTGRYNTGNGQRRELGTSIEWGGYASAGFQYGRLNLDVMRIEARNTPPDTPVTMVRGSICAYPTGILGICVDAMWVHGDEQGPLPVAGSPAPNTEANSLYGGASIGLHY